MSRVYNFSAGPAVLPEEVLNEAAAEMLDYRGTGMSVMEMSHRSKSYETIIEDAESDLRDLLHIPENYKVLFLQGGGSTQFAMVPMNLMKNRVADYIITGQWAKHTKRHLFTERQMPLLPVLTRLSAIFRIAPICLYLKMQIMCTSVKIIQFTEPSSGLSRIQRENC